MENELEEKPLEIGTPVTTVPSAKGTPGKYAEVYAQVEQLRKGEWLPILAGTLRQAQRLQECAKLRNFAARRRGLTVYLTKK